MTERQYCGKTITEMNHILDLMCILEEKYDLNQEEKEAFDISIECVTDTINRMRPTRPDKGTWVILENCANAGVYCSVCDTKIFEFTHRPKHKVSQFCPHCGAKMDQEKIVRM